VAGDAREPRVQRGGRPLICIDQRPTAAMDLISILLAAVAFAAMLAAIELLERV
jgi:hypothetical protein